MKKLTSQCKCSICIRNRRIKRIIKSKHVDSLIATIEELSSLLIECESDVEHLKCILNGTWPNAEIYLKNALANLKKKNKIVLQSTPLHTKNYWFEQFKKQACYKMVSVKLQQYQYLYAVKKAEELGIGVSTYLKKILIEALNARTNIT